MLRNPYAPYANAWESLKCKESSRSHARVPDWANPYAMPLTRNERCPPNVTIRGNVQEFFPCTQPAANFGAAPTAWPGQAGSTAR